MGSSGRVKCSEFSFVEEVLPKNVLWVRIKGCSVVIDENYVTLIAQTLKEEAKELELLEMA